MPEVTIHSNGSERKAVVVVNGVKKEFACDKAIDISDEYVEALKNSRFDVTEHDSAEGSAEAGEDEQSSPAQQPDGSADDSDQDGKEPSALASQTAAAQPKPAKATKATKAKA